MIEKSALVGVAEPACTRWRVPYMAVRGYNSTSELYTAGKRYQAYLESGIVPIVFHLGDHDPSGLHMTASLREKLSLYARHAIKVVRLALNLDQILSVRLPPNPAKEDDSRYEWYVETTGQTDSWELDALSPEVVDGLLDTAIAGQVDRAAWDAALISEQDGKDRLADAAAEF